MLRSAVRQCCSDGLCVHTDAIIFDLRENAAANRNGHADCELPVRSTDAPDRHIQPQGRLNDAELDAVVPAGSEADEAAVFVLTRSGRSRRRRVRVDLKNKKRATIVGETTGGGAHPVSGHTIADYFMSACHLRNRSIR